MSKRMSTLSMVCVAIDVMKFVFVIGSDASTGRVRQPPTRPRTAQVAAPRMTPETILRNIAFLLESLVGGAVTSTTQSCPVKFLFVGWATRPTAGRGARIVSRPGGFSNLRAPRLDNDPSQNAGVSWGRDARGWQRWWHVG